MCNLSHVKTERPYRKLQKKTVPKKKNGSSKQRRIDCSTIIALPTSRTTIPFGKWTKAKAIYADSFTPLMSSDKRLHQHNLQKTTQKSNFRTSQNIVIGEFIAVNATNGLKTSPLFSWFEKPKVRWQNLPKKWLPWTTDCLCYWCVSKK